MSKNPTGQAAKTSGANKTPPKTPSKTPSKKVSPRKIDRLEMRLEPRHKALIEEAAALTGQPLTAFAVSTLVERAELVLSQQHNLTVSRRDWKRICAALDHPPKPNKHLLALMRGDKIDDRAL